MSSENILVNTNDPIWKPFIDECTVCYNIKLLNNYYKCNLQHNTHHGLCSKCYNLWSEQQNTCPLCRSPRGPVSEINDHSTKITIKINNTEIFNTKNY